MSAEAPSPSKRPPLDAWRRQFIRRITTIALGLQVPFAFGLTLLFAPHLPGGALLAAPLVCALVLALNVPLWWRMLTWRDSQRANPLRTWLVDAPYTVHLCASMFSGVLAAAAMAVHAILAIFVPSLRVSPVGYVLGIYSTGFVLGIYATFVRRIAVRVRRVRVGVRDLPAELEGYTMAQLSDVHCGPNLPRWLYRSVAARACALGADLVVLTGDMITDGTGYLDDVRDLVSRLRAPDGVYAVMGNHDYFGTTEGVAEAMTAGGATMLRNESVRLHPARGGSFVLAGIEDTWTKRADLARTLAKRGDHAGDPCVLLAHDPDTFPAVAERQDVDLVLSGHTHAGQLAVPFLPALLNLSQLRHKFTSGVYREGICTLFVHHGIGVSGPPARLGAAPEIGLITLVRAK